MASQKNSSQLKRGFKNSISRKVGNTLIVLSILFFIILYGPFLLLFLPRSSSPNLAASAELSITIPKISAAAPIVSDVNPWDETEYRQKLKLGVAHAQGSALPGEKGTSYLFAHSSDLPWNLTRYNTAFFRLGQLSPGDNIFIKSHGSQLTYQVRETKVVWPNEVEYLTQSSGKDQLILQTCTPIGTSFKRLLVFADPV